MFNIKKTDSLFKCQQCQNVIKDPIFIPCGETVCKFHTDDINQGKCIISENHKAPQNGFPSNKFVQNLLSKELKANQIHLNFSQFNDYKKTIEDLNKTLKEIETMRHDPENYIAEYFSELTRQVDLRRETLIDDIQKYSEQIIHSIRLTN